MTSRSQIWDGAVWVDLTGGIDIGLDALYLRLDGSNVMTGSISSTANPFFINVVAGLGAVEIRANGITYFRSSQTNTAIIGAGNSFEIEDPGTTAEVANTNLAFNGITQRELLRISTSARKDKTNIVADPTLADLVLEPVRFHHDGDDKDYIGFIADDMPDEDAIVMHDGEIQNYDLRAVVAILAAKVNRLESP